MWFLNGYLLQAKYSVCKGDEVAFTDFLHLLNKSKLEAGKHIRPMYYQSKIKRTSGGLAGGSITNVI